MKKCSRCHIEKEDSEFRMRHDKRQNPVLYYLNNTCKKCDAEIQRIRCKKQRATPEGRKRHAAWAREFHKRHREKVLAYGKRRRQTPEYKAYMKAYRQKRKDIISRQEVITKRRYHEKNKNPITDKYIKNLLRTQGVLDPTDEQIEIKRAKVLIARIKNKVDAHKVGKTKKCTICGKEKDLSEFWKTNRNSSGRMYFCKSCGSAKNKIAKDERHSKSKKSSV